jgi:hypothetical protein
MFGDIDLIFDMRVYNHKFHSEKKVVTTKYLAKFQSPTAVSWPKIIQPELISHLICNL